ncbi:hypothetical protein [Microcoleus sp. F4-D5]|uniref:hypothetical protein n=1 Tax=Microcoleus sp. F4-D5 TaxID=2818760 RepID=UPI002FD54904
MSLDSESNWQIIYNQFHAAVGENPIDKILIPGVFAQHTIRAYCLSLGAKPHWWLGGRLVHLIGNTGPDFEVSRWTVPLKVRTLIRLPELTPLYRLKFEPARWHKEIAIVVESYIEPE